MILPDLINHMIYHLLVQQKKIHIVKSFHQLTYSLMSSELNYSIYKLIVS